MISIEESIGELEQCRLTRDTAIECYAVAIRNVAHYAIELEEDITSPHRKYLGALACDVKTATPAALQESRATFRGLLRDYRDKAAAYLHDLREQLASTARSLEEILESLAKSDGAHEARLQTAVARLRQSTDPGVLTAANTIEDSVEQMRKQHQLSVSQFLVEIRMLHKRIDLLERAASIDSLTNLLNRAEIEDRIRSLPHQDYGLLLLRVTGFRAAQVQYKDDVAAELAGAFTKRLRNSLPANAVIGRWGEEDFVALVVGMTTNDGIANAKWITEHLSGTYSCLQAGKTVRPRIDLSVAVAQSEGEVASNVLRRAAEFFT